MVMMGAVQHGLAALQSLSSWEAAVLKNIGLPETQTRFMVSFLASVLVAAFVRRIRTAKGRHWASLISGSVLLAYPFGAGVLPLLPPALLTYAAMKFFRPHCGKLAWLTFPYLIMTHVMASSGMAWKEGKMDATGALMVLTLKLVAVAVCYQDGLKSPEDLREYPASKRLPSLPTPLEFLSYLFAGGNLLAGPFCEAKDYLDWAEQRGDWDESKRRLPSRVVPGLARLAKGLACTVLWMWLVRTYNADLLESEAWAGLGLGRKAVLIWIVGVTCRMKYYSVWAIAESSLIFNGLCLEGYDAQGHPKWTRYINARMRRVELNPSLANLAANWNICTGTWLRHYIYERMTPRNRKPPFSAMVATQVVSGVWHGLFAGYFCFFITSAFMFEASKVIFRYEENWGPRMRNFAPWILLKVVFTAFILNYSAAAFIVLSLHEALAVWRSVYFLGHALILAILLISMVRPPRRRRLEEKVSKPKPE